ncbi:MAG: 30S ribosomal protein S5 [Rickettsiales endosymbiont of Dermacentor nuttalli]
MKSSVGSGAKHVNEESELKEILVYIGRVSKVVKGGKRFGFTAVVVVGDGKGRVGYGLGKAKEVTEARTKAAQVAKKSMMRIHLREGRTLHHDVLGNFGAGKVLLRSAKAGTGIIAGGAMRAVFEVLGIHDIVAKSIGSSNVHNMIGATFDALRELNSPRQIADKRSKRVGEIIERRETSGEVKS